MVLSRGGVLLRLVVLAVIVVVGRLVVVMRRRRVVCSCVVVMLAGGVLLFLCHREFLLRKGRCMTFRKVPTVVNSLTATNKQDTRYRLLRLQ